MYGQAHVCRAGPGKARVCGWLLSAPGLLLHLCILTFRSVDETLGLPRAAPAAGVESARPCQLDDRMGLMNSVKCTSDLGQGVVGTTPRLRACHTIVEVCG